MNLAMQMLHDGKREAASLHLALLAADPHGQDHARLAQRIVAKVKAEPNWDGSGAEQLAVPDAEDEGEPLSAGY